MSSEFSPCSHCVNTIWKSRSKEITNEIPPTHIAESDVWKNLLLSSPGINAMPINMMMAPANITVTHVTSELLCTLFVIIVFIRVVYQSAFLLLQLYTIIYLFVKHFYKPKNKGIFEPIEE